MLFYSDRIDQSILRSSVNVNTRRCYVPKIIFWGIQTEICFRSDRQRLSLAVKLPDTVVMSLS